MPCINLIVALPCEARPLIQFYQLKKNRLFTAFATYHNAARSINLIVSGVGRVRMAAALSALSHLVGFDQCSGHLNVGIAGSSDCPIGTTIVADKIVDAATETAYYPFLMKQKTHSYASVLTVDKPSREYPEAGVIDMEASAFFQTASLFVPHELIQCVKIVSDTNEAERNKIKPSLVEELITDRINVLDDVIRHAFIQVKKADKCFYRPAPSSLLKQYHFTTYQQHELNEMLRRWQVLLPTQPVDDILTDACCAKDVLNSIQQYLNNIDYIW